MAKLRVKMLQHLAGPSASDDLEPGKEYDLEAGLAQRLIDREFAEPVVVKKPRERATRAKRETATAQPAPQ